MVLSDLRDRRDFSDLRDRDRDRDKDRDTKDTRDTSDKDRDNGTKDTRINSPLVTVFVPVSFLSCP